MTSTLAKLVGVVLVLASCMAVQGSAAISSSLFNELSPAAVAGWRQLIGAAVLILMVRPRLRGRDKSQWAWILVLGLAMATMNVAFYSAVALLPLGVAATLLYLGPFTVAAIGFRRGIHLALPACALAGVLMISRPGSIDSGTGVIIGLLSGAALATYTIAGHRLGQKGGTDTLALALASSAVILSPVSLPTAQHLHLEQTAILLAAGVIGVAGAFWFDFTALRLIGTRAVSILFALDPVVGAITGALLLGQHLDIITTLGMIAIVISGAIAAGTAAHHFRG